jgi:hypothetical protein
MFYLPRNRERWWWEEKTSVCISERTLILVGSSLNLIEWMGRREREKNSDWISSSLYDRRRTKESRCEMTRDLYRIACENKIRENMSIIESFSRGRFDWSSTSRSCWFGESIDRSIARRISRGTVHDLNHRLSIQMTSFRVFNDQIEFYQAVTSPIISQLEIVTYETTISIDWSVVSVFILMITWAVRLHKVSNSTMIDWSKRRWGYRLTMSKHQHEHNQDELLVGWQATSESE